MIAVYVTNDYSIYSVDKGEEGKIRFEFKDFCSAYYFINECVRKNKLVIIEPYAKSGI